MPSRWSRFLSAQGSKPRSTAFKIRAMLLGALGFLVLAPLLLAAVGRLASRAVALTVPRPAEIAAGSVAVGLGILLLIWAASVFWRSGQGTPAPVAAPQRLVVSGPYRHVRNPIQLGAVGYFFGFGCLADSLVAGLVMFLLGLAIGSAYHKFVEEPELRLRFGAAYEEYRRRTPFLLPRLGRSAKRH